MAAFCNCAPLSIETLCLPHELKLNIDTSRIFFIFFRNCSRYLKQFNTKWNVDCSLKNSERSDRHKEN